MEMDFKELANDKDIVTRLTNFTESIDNIEKALQFAEDPELYEKLSNEEKIKYNLLMSFSLNGLFWMYLRANGVDPNKHPIKTENERLKESMARAKQIHDRNTIRPKLNQDAAKRFVRNGLWTPVQRPEEMETSTGSTENWDE